MKAFPRAPLSLSTHCASVVRRMQNSSAQEAGTAAENVNDSTNNRLQRSFSASVADMSRHRDQPQARRFIDALAAPRAGMPTALRDSPEHHKIVATICDMSHNPQFLELFVADVGIDLVMQHAEASREIAEQCASAVNPHTGLRFQMSEYLSVVQNACAQQGSAEENAVADRKAGVNAR